MTNMSQSRTTPTTRRHFERRNPRPKLTLTTLRLPRSADTEALLAELNGLFAPKGARP